MAASSSVSDLCRLCGTSTLNIVRNAIFEGEGRLKKYACKIQECLPLQVTEEDPLPKIMCGECTYKLDLLSEFRDKAVKTEVMLVSLVDGVKPELPDDDGPDHDIDNDDFRSSSPEQPEPEVLIKEEEQQPEKRPGRKAANKRPIRESDDEEEEEAPVKKRGRKPKESTTTAAAAAPPKENSGPPPLVVRIKDAGSQPMIGAPLFQCRHCSDLFETLKAVKRHIWETHRLKCAMCDFTADKEDKLKEHVRKQHDDKENMPRCCVCLRVCVDREAYRAHLLLHIGALPYECEKCERLFADRGRLTRHLKRHLDGESAKTVKSPMRRLGRPPLGRRPIVKKPPMPTVREHFCADCKAHFRTRDELRRHNRDTHRCQCPCGQVFQSDYYLQVHRSKHHPEWVHPCRNCEETFNTPMQLARHVDKNHEKQTYPCQRCGEVMSSMVGMMNHRMANRCNPRKSAKSLPRPGRFQTAEAKAKSNLAKIRMRVALVKKKARLEMEKMKAASKRMFCLFCGRTFMDKASLEEHMLAHLRNYGLPQAKAQSSNPVCHLCQLVCPSDTQMQTHLKKHENGKRMECKICRCLVVSQTQLDQHMLKHEDTVAPFFCDTCGLNFRIRSDGNHHIRAYHGRKNKLNVRPEGAHLEVSRRPSSNSEKMPTPSSDTTGAAAMTKDCPICAHACKDIFTLNRHLLDVHDLNRDLEQKCISCQDKFENLDTLIMHLKLTHLIHVKMPLRCSDCDQILLNAYNLSRHRHHVHPQCPYCKVQLQSRAMLVSHVSSKHPGMPEPNLDVRYIKQKESLPRKENPQPELNKEGNASTQNLPIKKYPAQSIPIKNEPVQTLPIKTEAVPPSAPVKIEPTQSNEVLLRPLSAPLVPLVIPTMIGPKEEPPSRSQSALRLMKELLSEPGPSGLSPSTATPQVHLPATLMPKRSRCTFCEFQCSTMSQLKFHLVNAHFFCTECSIRFKSQDELQEHLKAHPNRKCPLCSAKLNTGPTMQMHITRKHQNEPICSVCLELQTSMEELETHYAEEHPQMGRCDICLCFLKRGSLNSHKRTKHSLVEKIKCPECSKCFASKSTLDSHMRIHLGVKPYRCPCCVESFYNGPLLIRHAKVHGLEDSGCIVCPWCRKVVRSVTDLAKHVATVEECGKRRDLHCQQQPRPPAEANGENGSAN